MPDAAKTRSRVAPAAGVRPPITERGFWALYTGAWLAYLGLFVSAALGTEGMAAGVAWTAALGSTLPPAGLGVLVALRRGALLRPERRLGATVLLHVLVCLGYATSAAALVGLLARGGWGYPAFEAVGAAEAFWYRVVNGIFLFAVLDGFLMWSESLRRVHESERAAAGEAMLRAQAEAKALRAQFNPHFVFNTLHSLMLLVRSDPGAAERAIEDVAELIRYASVLQRRDIDLVPLARELEVARRYLALEKLRLGERLRVEWTVEVEPERVGVPAFALQTLLDNAIRHGIEPGEDGGTVQVGVRSLTGKLQLAVEDDGEGADPARVMGAAGRGLGLLRRRLETLYGDEGRLAWTTAPGHGFRVTLEIPERPPPAEGPPPAREGSDVLAVPGLR